MSLFDAICSVESYILLSLKSCIFSIFLHLSEFNISIFVLLCMFGWWLYLFGCGQIYLGSPCILKKMRRRKMGENLRSRGSSDPSATKELKISDVGAFCLWMRRQRARNGVAMGWKKASWFWEQYETSGTLKIVGMELEKRLAPIQESGDHLTPMGKWKRSKANAATSKEIIFLCEN